jgi:hypothetical protein
LDLTSRRYFRWRITFSIPPCSLGKADVKFDVKQDGFTLGQLTVSKGSLVWFPAGTNYGKRLGWARFGLLMEEHATSVEKR